MTELTVCLLQLLEDLRYCLFVVLWKYVCWKETVQGYS